MISFTDQVTGTHKGGSARGWGSSSSPAAVGQVSCIYSVSPSRLHFIF